MKGLALVLLFLISACTQKSNTSEVFATSEGAIQGYDPVAYFTDSKPVKGTSEHVYSYLDQSWHFVSKEHLELFKSNPEKYVPQFGGYCAYGMSRGYKAQTDPDAWTIAEGKLYLNYNLEVRATWNANQTELINKANANWPTVRTSEFN